MGEFTDKAIGKTKKNVGKYTGNRGLQARGTLQELRGRAKGALGEIGRSARRAKATVRRKAVGGRPSRPKRGRRSM